MIQTNILVAFLLNLGFSLFELVGGLWTGSMAILSDSLHDLIDALTIGLSYFLEKKSNRPADEKYTYGYRRFSVLGALLSSVVLIAGAILIIWASVQRLISPIPLDGNGMVVISIVGIVINYLAFKKTHSHDRSLNQKAVNLHMLEDVAGWIIVFVGSLLIKFTGIAWLDPLMSIGISLYLIWEAVENLLEISNIFLLKCPQSVDEIIEEIKKLKGVDDVHHVHLWSLDGEKLLLTAHVVGSSKVKQKIKNKLSELGISHSVLEFETKKEDCQDLSC